MPQGTITANSKPANNNKSKPTKKTTKAAKGGGGGRPVGRTSGVGVQETWVQVFKENEKTHLTDEQISARMKKEFPGRNSSVFDHVAGVRNKYNKGGLTGGEVPKVQSRRFGEDGKEVSARGFALAPKGGASKGKSSKTTKKAA